MGLLKDHLETAAQLEKAVAEYRDADDWPIQIDAGFYAVYHTMEAIHAIGCRDTNTFADGFDLLERIMVPEGFSTEFVHRFNYLFYFRRGAIYNAHVPSETQLAEYRRVAAEALAEAKAVYKKANGRQAALA